MRNLGNIYENDHFFDKNQARENYKPYYEERTYKLLFITRSVFFLKGELKNERGSIPNRIDI